MSVYCCDAPILLPGKSRVVNSCQKSVNMLCYLQISEGGISLR